MYNCIILLRYLASLYAGAPFQLTMGRMGQSALCIFGSPRIFGAVGFILVSFLLKFLGSMDWQDFIAIPTTNEISLSTIYCIVSSGMPRET